jgi:DNA-3-methyladenine glycosylase
MKPGRALPESFYLRDTVEVARALLGCILWRNCGGIVLAIRIVETEAYLGERDTACHSRGGHRSPRNESMYLRGGRMYVYFTYGMHYCANVVTREEGVPEAVLLRAGEPLAGTDIMRANRGDRPDTDLASGPAKLCQALAIDRALDGAQLRGPELLITRPLTEVPDTSIAVSRRIGVERSGESAEWPLRFYIDGNPHVSRGKGTRTGRSR